MSPGAYLADVLLYPMQQKTLIEDTSIERSVLSNLFAVQKAKDADAVAKVEVHNVAAALTDDLGAIVVGISIIPVATALDKDPDWQLGLGRCVGWLEDVDVEAILCSASFGSVVDAEALGRKLYLVSPAHCSLV